MKKIKDDERYKVVRDGEIRKVDTTGKPDTDGFLYVIVEKLPNGFTVYPQKDDIDPSQPASVFYIDKNYIIGEN